MLSLKQKYQYEFIDAFAEETQNKVCAKTINKAQFSCDFHGKTYLKKVETDKLHKLNFEAKSFDKTALTSEEEQKKTAKLSYNACNAVVFCAEVFR